MNYSDEFIHKCKLIYPLWKDLHAALIAGGEIVGRYLDDARQERVSAEMIMQAKSLTSLQRAVIHMQKRDELYGEWMESYQEWRNGSES